MHETLLFGFDQEREVFFSTALQKSGKFEEVEIPFSQLLKSFNSIYVYFKDNPRQMVERREYFYNITQIQLMDDFCEDNSIFLMFKKIDYEILGVKSVYSFFNEEAKIINEDECFTGLACLVAIHSDIKKRLIPDSNIPEGIPGRLTKTLKKLHEHRNITFLSMEWLIKKLEINDPNVIDSVIVYKKCCDNMNKLYLMAYKFEITRDLSISNRIQDQLLEQDKLEYVTLLQFNKSAKACYYSSQKL